MGKVSRFDDRLAAKYYREALKERERRASHIRAGERLTIHELYMLQIAAAAEAGLFVDDLAPPSSFCGAMVVAGYFVVVEEPGFWGGTYRITEAGRERERRDSPPVGEW